MPTKKELENEIKSAPNPTIVSTGDGLFNDPNSWSRDINKEPPPQSHLGVITCCNKDLIRLETDIGKLKPEQSILGR